MGTIRSLPRDVVERIAAGEVVERPASVVKELVENAIDAGARRVSVTSAEGGRRITVIDDGRGMDADDLAASVMRHATSKIASEEDLFRITTMGFRGEALAAIGAVSRLTVESKPSRAEVIEGGRIVVTGGEVDGPHVAGCSGGTRVDVADIFYNVPARLKFLKSAGVEAGHIYDVVATYALAYPWIRFELTTDGADKLRLPACETDIGEVASTERIGEILGDRANGAVVVDEVAPDMAVRGVVAESGRKGGKDVHIFLNGRPVRDRMLMHALVQGAGERVHGGYPAAALWIEIDPAKVDVNVHPAKREVRFADGSAVYSFLMSAVRKPVSQAPVGVEAAIMRFEERREVSRARGDVRGSAHFAPRRNECETPEQAVAALRGSLSPIGQYALSYVVCEDDDGSLVLIDQHAAHERLGFEQLRESFEKGSVPRQGLLIPEQVELGEKSCAYIVDSIEKLGRAGFEIEPFGGGTLLVKAVPAIAAGASATRLMEKLAAELEDIGESSSLDEAMERIFAVVACHRQVRAGDRLGPEELRALARDVERGGITSCPHGRPAVVRIRKEEIEKWFGRR
jgi:DNA mismatch repair protein MutL